MASHPIVDKNLIEQIKQKSIGEIKNSTDLKNLEEFFGIKFPDFCEGYYCPGHDFKPYTGNSILDVVDPIDELYSILCDRRNKETFYNFSFYIGFSKSNFNKMIRG